MNQVRNDSHSLRSNIRLPITSESMQTSSGCLSSRSTVNRRTLLLEFNGSPRYNVRHSLGRVSLITCFEHREGRPGFRLRLAITVMDVRSCSPMTNTVVDLWHCDGVGLYSHYIAASQGQMGAPTDASTFFRGKRLLVVSPRFDSLHSTIRSTDHEFERHRYFRYNLSGLVSWSCNPHACQSTHRG